MEHKIIVVGIGPGAAEYIAPIGRKYIDEAQVIAGGQRALDTLAGANAMRMAITGDIESVMNFIAANLVKTDVVVMVSGDPGYYSLLVSLRKRFGAERLTVVPGISALQFAFARIALPWQEARLLSFHGRTPPDEALWYAKGETLGVLTDRDRHSGAIAVQLRRNGWPRSAEVYLCARLSYEDEKITALSLEQAVDTKISHCVMVVIG